MLNASVNWLSFSAAEQRSRGNDMDSKTCFPRVINILFLQSISVDCKADKQREEEHSSAMDRCFNLVIRGKRLEWRCAGFPYNQHFSAFKAGVHLNFNKVKRFKKGQKEENKFWNTNRQLIPTQEHPRFKVDQYFGVHPLIFNFKF